MMKAFKSILLASTLLASIAGALIVTAPANEADAGYRAYRQYYSSWSYHPVRTYYYRSYYYKPTVNYNGYHHHYCIHYPSRPRYVYYYNPYRKRYWGRFDLEKQGYSKLAEKDQKATLDEIPEEAFPEAGPMPNIPEAEDEIQIEKIKSDDLPKVEEGK